MRAELEREAALLWQALADRTRRRILDLLTERPRTTGDIASHFDISRIAVMRHLDVLGEAGLVTSRKRGRERWHYLNALPLQRIRERWLDPVAAGWASALLRLQDRVETGSREMTSDRPVVDVALDLTIAASPARVFAALTRDPGGWWGHPFVRAKAISLSLDARLGGLFIERWADGGSVLATVTGWADDRHLELTGPFHFSVAVGVASFDLAGTAQQTDLRFSFRAIGAIGPDVADQASRGWTELVAERLKALAETGTRMGIAPDPPQPPSSAPEGEGNA
jgi:DNA-binding transcriptional ArsR family regulator/uncharacterized protein YndB with AHSA1/START domain